MATIALTQTAIRRRDAGLITLAEKNLRYNLAQFYRSNGELGLIEYHGKVKLGGVALAALAIVEHPNRSAFAHEEVALRRTVDHLWQPDGSFRTFYEPRDRNDNQNFYPGEALLLWSRLFEESRDEELLRRIMTSFQYYKVWHLANRNPAFVPWQTQAYARIWRITHDPTLRDFIFTMNDWLLSIQRVTQLPYPDVAGDFYDPERPEFGPPHASSLGVYLHSIAQAVSVADASSDHTRAVRYRSAAVLGLRAALQLEFYNTVDTYYEHSHAVVGGIRTTLYNNEIRVDNIQHMLQATSALQDAALLSIPDH
jgi:hypothetical protein